VSIFAKGVLATIVTLGALFGMIYALLAMVLGTRLAYWVEGSVTFGVLAIMSVIWFGTGLGPAGPDTAWEPVAAGPNLTQASAFGQTYNVGDYPGDSWEKPKVGARMADLKGADDTESEATQAKLVMDAFVSQIISPIPGVQQKVAPKVHGSVDLIAGQFTDSDLRMKPAIVKGKASIIAVAKAVPSEAVTATLAPGVTEGTAKQYLVDVGQQVTAGQDVLVISTAQGDMTIKSPDSGVLVVQSLRPGDKVRGGGPFAVLDISSHPGQPPPVIVVAARVRGALRTPPMFFLLASLILFAAHVRGLSKFEKSRKAALVETS
jgi:biotin carboxyl carrier protein